MIDAEVIKLKNDSVYNIDKEQTLFNDWICHQTRYALFLQFVFYNI